MCIPQHVFIKSNQRWWEFHAKESNEGLAYIHDFLNVRNDWGKKLFFSTGCYDSALKMGGKSAIHKYVNATGR